MRLIKSFYADNVDWGEVKLVEKGRGQSVDQSNTLTKLDVHESRWGNWERWVTTRESSIKSNVTSSCTLYSLFDSY